MADEFDLDFRRLDRPPPTRLFDGLARHVGFTEGLLNAWDIKTTLPKSPYIGIHGLLGELYRRQGTARYRSAAKWAEYLAGDRKDLGDLVDPAMRRCHRDGVEHWLEGLAADGVDLSEFAADVFYMRQRIPRWMGQAKLNDGLWGVHFNPIFHRHILQVYYQLSVADRAQERVHYELMSRLAAELVGSPLAGDTWNEQMVRRSTRPSIDIASAGVEHKGDLVGTGWQLSALSGCWPEVRQRARRVGQLSGEVISTGRVDRLMDVASVLIGQSPSMRHTCRVGLAHPLLLLKCRRDMSGMVRRILGLLTIQALCADLRTIRSDTM